MGCWARAHLRPPHPSPHTPALRVSHRLPLEGLAPLGGDRKGVSGHALKSDGYTMLPSSDKPPLLQLDPVAAADPQFVYPEVRKTASCYHFTVTHELMDNI